MQKIIKVLESMTYLYNKNMPKEAIMLMLNDLNMYSEEQLLDSLKKCRSELKFFPSIAEIKERVNDGHLSPNEAWAMCPKSEDDSVCWSEEMRDAYFSVHSIVRNGDLIAARVGFIEKYKELIRDSRSNMTQIKFELSIGNDKSLRETSIQRAVFLGCITTEKAKQLLPENSDLLLIENKENVNKIKQIACNCTKCLEG